MHEKFPHLLSPGRIGSVQVRNRIVFLPHYPAFETDDGTITDTYVHYYAERAKGGAGLLITESFAVHPLGKTASKNLEAWDPKVLPGYRRMSATAHEYGAKMFVQLSHGGHTTLFKPPQLLLAPSQMSEPSYHYNTKEMDIDDIKAVIEGFAVSAGYVKQGGFDGVEIKGAAHDGLLRAFISPYFNRRKDRYGGSFENRMRLSLEVVDAVRQAVGPDFAFGVRICMDEFTTWGYGVETGIEIVKAFTRTGAVDYISTDAGCFSSFYMEIPPMCIPPGFAECFSAEIKKITDVPVIAFGRINDPVQAENILRNGSADFIGMARELICDPEFANKAFEGRDDDIRHCVACQDGCIYQVMQDEPLCCIQNPAAGREAELGIGTIRRAKQKKRIVVIGGGPAGLKFAEVAARRGHAISLYEAGNELGGQINIASRIPYREEIKEVVRHLILQIERYGVEVHLNQAMTAQTVMEIEERDAVVVATGSHPAVPDIRGAAQKNVVTVWDVLLDAVTVGAHVVVYDITRRWPGLGTAEFLIDRGKTVNILTPAFYVGQQLEPSNVCLSYSRILRKGAKLIPNVEVTAIEDDLLTITNVYTHEESLMPGVDTLVMSCGNESNNDLYRELEGEVNELYCIGDAVAPRLIQQSIFEAEQLGRSI
jgi:mycofactocin system FadH/OYE family oxidoreductase 2